MPRPRSPALVVMAGACAALHVGKLPPALQALQASFGLTLVQAGFLLSLVQGAGMVAAIAFGAWSDQLGARRSMVAGLTLLAGTSMLGAGAHSTATMLALRALEGAGFLLVILPGPGLLRRLVPPKTLQGAMGFWGSYMPFGTSVALLVGAIWVERWGWRSGWLALGVLSLAMAVALARGVPADAALSPATNAQSDGTRLAARRLADRLRETLSTPGPWWVALIFALYAAQWLAVIGFLPAIVAAAGLGGAATGALTALVSAVNIVGNVGGGRLLQRGVPASRLLRIGLATMALSAVLAYSGVADAGLPPLLRYAAILLFSMVGGLVPVALFSLALRVAPSERTVGTTVGWMMQGSSLGQFFGPPLVAWVASRAGGWQWTGATTALLALAGWLAVWPLAAWLVRGGTSR